MKALILIFMMAVTAKAFSQNLTRADAERLLQQRNVNLQQVESQGGRLIIGEVTGGGRVVPVERVQAVIVADRAVLKREIISMDFQPSNGNQVGQLDSFRVGGSYYTREDVRAIVVGR